MKKLLIGLSSLFVLLFTGCGGGGGGDSTTTTITASLANTNQYDLRTFIDTAAYTIDGEGTITSLSGSGATIATGTGTYQSSYQGTEVVTTGETVHLHDITMLLDAGGIAFEQSASSTTYMGNIIGILHSTDVSCGFPIEFLATITPVPTDAQVGYISDEISLECDDGTYITNVLELNDAGGGNAELSIISNTYVSQGGALQSSETDNIVVTPTMSMVNADITGSIPADGITFVLYSTNITEP